MTWTTIPDFATGDIVRAETFQDLWGNLYHIRNPLHVELRIPEGVTTWTNTNTSIFADIDTTYLRHQFESAGNDLLLGVMVDHFHSASNGAAAYTFELDGTALGNTNGLARLQKFGATSEHVAQMLYIATGVPEGDHTLDLQWKNVTAGTATFFADSAVKFFVKEL